MVGSGSYDEASLVFGRYLSVSCGGTADQTRIEPGGHANVSSGGTTYFGSMGSGDTLYVLAGGSATGDLVSGGGELLLGGRASVRQRRLARHRDARLTLFGSYVTNDFVLSSDGAGGTSVGHS